MKKRENIALSLISAFLLLLPVCLSSAPQKIYFKIGAVESLDADGIKFKSFKDCASSPLPMPETRTFENRETGEKYERYNPNKLWMSEQCAGVWQGEVGKIIIGKISIAPPEIGNEKQYKGLVPKKDYDEWRKDAQMVDLSDADSVSKWMRAFFSEEDLSPDKELKSVESPKNCTITKYITGDTAKDARKSIYLLSPKDFPELKFAVCYDAVPLSDVAKNEKAIASSLLSFAFSKPKTKTAPAVSGTAGSLKNIERTPEYLASKENVIKNIQNFKDWNYTETENFILVYNITNKKTIKDMGENLEKSRSVFAAFYPLKIPLKAVSVCRFFDKRDDYLKYAGTGSEWTAGRWEPSRKELIISPFDWASRSNNRKIMIDITYYASFQQYLHYAVGEASSSIWFNVGSAAFFKGINFRGGDKFEINLTERLDLMKKLASSAIDIKKFVGISDEEFANKSSLDKNHALAWGLMFFLQKGSQVIKEKNNYSEIPSKYYDSLVETGDRKKADEDTWKDVDMTKFEKDFTEFWSSDSLIKKAERFNPITDKKK
jgi:hypothetical protein